ncbi:MAG: ribonuclease J [Myxococcales bacterium]
MTERVRLVPLGGLGEIGMNCMSVECGDQRLLIDCGVTFPDHPFGTDVIRPDFSFLKEEPRARTALWVTHGHEDHIGAIPYLLREHPMPVYGPPYALALIKERLSEHALRRSPELFPIAPGQRFQFGPFDAEPVRVTHSIADATALALSTPVGTIIHTGDFKIDPTPPDHERFDAERFRALGDAGVRLLLSDSTNVDTEGSAGSEQPVASMLEELVEAATGRVLITLFASNTHRLRAALDIARRTRRKLCWLGRSVQTHSRVAQSTGYLDRSDDILITPQQAMELPRQRVLFAATGSQAEPASALARIARRVHPQIALEPGDTVILSSRIIPGNDRPVIDVIDRLLLQGVEVVERRTNRAVHVSGHAHRQEQRTMLELTRPEFFMPVHGTFHHLSRHAELAREMGVRHTTLAQNGDVVELDARSLRVVDRVTSGRVHVMRGQDVPDEVLADRSRLAELGTIAVSFVVDVRGNFVTQPDLSTRGVLLGPEPREFVSQARLAAKRAFRQAVDDSLLNDLDALREHVRRRMTRFFLESIGQRAVCMVLVHVVKH